MSDFETKYLIFTTGEDELSVRLNHKKSYSGALDFFIRFFLLVITLFCIFATPPSYGHAILFGFLFLICIINAIYVRIADKKHLTMFSLKIDESGVKHNDANGKFTLSWNEIKSFGLVDKNPMAGIHKDGPYQTCLYFSTDIHEERYLRHRFDRILNKKYRHCSSNDMIVLSLHKDNISDELKSTLYKYIHMYCDPALEVSFITNTTEQAME